MFGIRRSSPGQPSAALPQTGRPDAEVAGHWVLARLGKRVLRPGGRQLTTTLLAHAAIAGADVVELAPGLGRTARDILDLGPRSYLGVDADAQAVAAVTALAGGRGSAIVADASSTGLPDASVDVVVGEAMLTMQGEKAKAAIVSEAARVLRPGGRYAVHELALVPDDIDEAVKTEIRQSLARSIRVNSRPQTLAEWRSLLEGAGLVVERVDTAPMALLEPRRLVADEGLGGAVRFVAKLLTHPDARTRVLAMRHTFRSHQDAMLAVALVARKPR
ncbi:MAG: methyltransferase domain-containing protein [Dermatophilaceae bacterium]